MASWMAGWAMIGLAVGHADAVRLLAANTFVQAARALGTLEVMQVLARRVGANKAVFRESRRTAVKLDLIGLATCWGLVALLVGFLVARGMEEAAAMLAIVSLSIPARHPGSVFIARRSRNVPWRMGAGIVAVVGGALVWWLGLGWEGAAVVLALRDWAGLAMTAAFGPRRKDRQHIVEEPLRFPEAAGRTEASARRRLGYRMMKSLFAVILGPFGNFAARTGRGAGRLDAKVARFIPRHRPGMALFTAGTAGGAAVLLATSREPAALLGAAALARLAGSGGAALLWWNYGNVQVDEEDDDDD